MSIAATALNLFAPIISKTLGKIIPDADTRDQIEKEIKLGVLENSRDIDRQAGDIVLAEASSEHWLTASWRPIAALMMTVAIGLNLIIVPVAEWFGIGISYELPEQVWTTFNIMLGGYVASRGVEKVAKEMKK